MDTESRLKDLADMVVAKWFGDNYAKGLHLEEFDENASYPLMASHMRKLASDENFEPPEHVQAETLDKIFRTIIKSGLITPVNPKNDAAEKAEAARRKAQEEEVRRDLHYQWFYDTHSNQQNVEEARRNPDYKKWLDNVKRAGLKVPEAPASQSNPFIIRSISNGVIRYVASDGLDRGAVVLSRDRQDAFAFGRTRAERFAELLRKQQPQTVDIIPLAEPSRSAEVSGEYVRDFIRERWEAEKRR